MNSGFQNEIDIRRILSELLYKAWIIILAGIVGGCASYFYSSKFVTPVYKATTLMYVNNISEEVHSQVVRVTNSDIDTSQALVQTYMAFLSSDQILDGVAEEFEGRYTTKKLKSMISASAIDETELFKISVSHPSPKEAQKIANSVADKAAEVISKYVDGTSIKVVDYAKLPENQAYPSVFKNTFLGFVGGAGIAVLIIVLLLLFNEKISGEDELKALFDEPVIGKIPDFEKVYEEKYLYKYRHGYGSRKYVYKSGKDGDK